MRLTNHDHDEIMATLNRVEAKVDALARERAPVTEERAYLLGFMDSEEGWNGEYPFDGNPDRVLEAEDFIKKRVAALSRAGEAS